MSIDTNVYLGPYAEWLLPVVKKRVDRCGHQPPKKSSGYCSDCGVNLKNRWDEEEGVDSSNPEVEELTDERLMVMSGICGWPRVKESGKEYKALRVMSNLKGTCGIHLDINAVGESGEVVIDPISVATENVIFKKIHGEDLKAIEEFLGEPPVVKWGLLVWYS